MFETVDFNISAAVETARLSVWVNDRFGRLMDLASVDLLLMSMGDNEINPPAYSDAPYLIRYPEQNQTIKGGILLLQGLANPVNESPLIIELVTEDGNIVGSNTISVAAPSGDLSHTPFILDIPYTVNAIAPVRLTIRQESTGRIPGTVALSSMTLVIEP